MIKLYTGAEAFEGCTNVYTPDYKSFYTVGEPKGTFKSIEIDSDFESYLMLETTLEKLGLKDYINIFYHEGEVYMNMWI